MMCHVAYKNIAEFGGHRHYNGFSSLSDFVRPRDQRNE